LVPTLLGQEARQPIRDYHYWEAAPAQALRQGDWKLYRATPDQPGELYHLAMDIGERRNVASEYPELAKRLTKLLDEAHLDSEKFPLAPPKKNR
ncbi:MAG: sulfatase, partial [Pirellulaceae bacterium]